MKLDEEQIEWVKSQVRQELRRTQRKAKSLERKFAKDADFTKLDLRKQWLEKFYRELGGDVTRISNYE